MTRTNAIWVAPNATAFSCLCETCLEHSRAEGRSFVEAVRTANVRGRLSAETDVGFAYCTGGHEVVVRRVRRPLHLTRRDERQMQLV